MMSILMPYFTSVVMAYQYLLMVAATVDVIKCVLDWLLLLRLNADKSRANFATTEPRRLKLERMQDELVLDLDLEAIKWNADLKAFNYGNCLTSLRSIFESDPEVREIVR